MWHKLKSFFVPQEKQENETFPSLYIVTAALCWEVVQVDFETAAQEVKRMEKYLAQFFKLNAQESKQLMELGRLKHDQHQDIWHFTHLIKKHFSREQKQRLLVLLWKLVFADGKKDPSEDALLRKITQLLGLEHGDLIAAKTAAQQNIA